MRRDALCRYWSLVAGLSEIKLTFLFGDISGKSGTGDVD